MKRFFLFVFISFLSLALQGTEEIQKTTFTALLIRFPEAETTRLPGARVMKFPDAETARLQIRVREVKRGWSSWETVKPDLDLDEHDGASCHPEPVEGHPEPVEGCDEKEVLYQTNESTDFEFRWLDLAGKMMNAPAPRIEPFSYGRRKTITSKLLASLEVPKEFRIIKRDEWGADPTLLFETEESIEASPLENGLSQEVETEGLGPPQDQVENDPAIERIVTKNEEGKTYRWPLQYAKEIKSIVLHHTASQRNLDNPEVAIQNIYFYHSVRRNWGDIGYNFLIDPKGNIYEGRYGGDKIIGGHARPYNKISVGIAVLGNYDEGELPLPILRSLLTFTNALREKYGLDEKAIIGHRDVSKTICPGKFFYGNLPGLRKILDDSAKPKGNEIFEEIGGELVILPPESEKRFEIRLKNRSSEVWRANTAIRLLSPIFGFDDLVFQGEKEGTLLASLVNFPVFPGEIGRFTGKAKSHIFSGLKIFDGKVVMNRMVARESDPPLLIAFFVEGVEPSYELAFRQDPKNLLMPGEAFEGFIELKNTGNVTWRRDGPNRIVLAASQPRGRKSLFFNGEIMATLSQDTVKPREVGRFIFQGKAPFQTGIFEEHFVPRIDGIRHLEDKGFALNFEVRGDAAIRPPPFPIRIKLSFSKNPVITSEKRLMVYDGAKFKKAYPPKTRLSIQPLKNGKFLVRGRGKISRFEGPVRIRAHPDGILTLTNWHRKDREFRGILEVRKGPLIINELPLEEYLRGVAEETNDTPPEKIKAIAILARTYAQFYMTKAEKFPGKPYHLDDDPRNTQKYLGYSFEKRAPNVVKGVEETKGKVVTYQGKLVKTPYFSQSDGRTRSGEEVFGWKTTPYLTSVPDPDCAGLELRGHGVGLSGCGAHAKALRGETAEMILKYYYQGIEILSGK